MFARSIMFVVVTVVLIGLGCSSGIMKPGTGGKSTAQKLKTGHPAIPDGVRCYVCHKNERLDVEFHRNFGVTCDNCHDTTTWMALKYPHEKWPLGIHRKMQCSRCHEKMNVYDFSEWQCWGCHHEPKETGEFHKKLGHDNIDDCIACHKGIKDKEGSP